MELSTRHEEPVSEPELTGRGARAREVTRRWSASIGLALLIADPRLSPRDGLLSELQGLGLTCTWCKDGAETLVQYGRLTPDALVMSPFLELVDAETVVRSIRERSSVPILLGVGAGEADAAGPVLLAGATAAVAHPYDPAEIMRVLNSEVADPSPRGRLSYGPLELDPQAYVVRFHGNELRDLPLKEFQLLRLLMTNADHVVTIEKVRQALWGDAPHSPASNAISVHVARLRAKIGGPTVLRTVRGLGYRLTFTGYREDRTGHPC